MQCTHILVSQMNKDIKYDDMYGVVSMEQTQEWEINLRNGYWKLLSEMSHKSAWMDVDIVNGLLYR